MGVAGCGKSTTGTRLADALAGAFFDADDLHPATNKAKMASGQPLTDDDRWPWLHAVGSVFQAVSAEATTVVACSALRRVYRDLLRATAGRPLVFVHLTGTRDLHAARLRDRVGHFMPPTMLDSQLATLEPLEPDEAGIAVSITDSPDDIVERVLGALATPAPARMHAADAE
ncbi:gluconokinase [Rathayibacter festucae]|uniref:gluconokinase n=1 Tax=Rathayibacter festucae TaxID=110937 RepID=UPI002A6A8E11|nr:gluconokinase [Rathayibacter festucae]MDY0914547.1 gluconokinase [Rathayibacter festucae]